MAADFRLIIRSLGLQGLKPVVYRAQYVPQAQAGVQRDYSSYDDEDLQTVSGATPDARRTWLGTPVFSDVMFPIEGSDPIRLDTVLVEVRQRKTIVTTAVNNRPGTVKEYISLGDYEVTLRGAIVTDGSNKYPYSSVRDLHELLTRSEALDVVSDYLRLYDIYQLVVMDFAFPQRPGFQNLQAFEINCLSDIPDDLISDADSNL